MREHNLNLNDFELDEIESIELIGEEDTIDITVEDTHMFFANDIYTHNSSIKAEVVESDQTGGSIKKGQIAHFIISFAKSLDQKENGTANAAILKSRFSKDGIILQDIIFNNATIQIDMTEQSSVKTRGEYKKDKEKEEQHNVAALLTSLQKRKKALEHNQEQL